MNIRSLEIFKQVCLDKSITAAAKSLYLSQPAVSLSIAQLEESLGYKLFDRKSGKIFLNDNGSLFLEKVEELLILYERILLDTQDAIENKAIVIGSSITIANDFLSESIQAFKKLYPKTQVKVIVKNAYEIEKSLLNGDLDLALFEGALVDGSLHKILLSSYELCILASHKHPLSMKASIHLDELLSEDFLLREQGSANRDLFDSMLRLKDLKVEPLWESINSQALIKAVEANLGITVLPKILVEDQLTSQSLVALKVLDFELSSQNYMLFKDEEIEDERVRVLKEILLSKAI